MKTIHNLFIFGVLLVILWMLYVVFAGVVFLTTGAWILPAGYTHF